MSIEKIEQAIRDHVGKHGVRGRAMFTLDGVRALLDELSRLRTALKPFAKEAEAWVGYEEIEPLTEGWQNGPSTHLNVGHLRVAARALSEREGQE